jgi:KDO2-lipid IV(A) lauroyltransferase
VRKNLTECFPEKTEKEIIKIEKGFYHFLVDTIMESVKMFSITPKEMKRRMKLLNVEGLMETMRKGRSASVFMGHYGNWEWVSSLPIHLDDGMLGVQIYHELSNKVMNRLVLYSRGRMGAISVEMRKTVRDISKMKSEGKVAAIGFIADQSPRKKDAHYYLNFLNHEVPALVGTEKLTKHYGFEAWYLNVKRVKRGYYEAEFVRLHENPSELPDFKLTEIYYQRLEEMIKTQPELYLWSHNRFRLARKK